MALRAPRTISIALSVAAALLIAPTASARSARHPPKQVAPRVAHGVVPHRPAIKGARAKLRTSRGSARQEAARLGALVGNGCNGRAAMQRNERQWVVLCSNGKTYLVETPSPQARGAPAIECSLPSNGRDPACFAW